MPIKDVSEVRRFSRGGKIRLGEKKISKNGNEYPSKLDYFLFDPIDESLIPKFQELFGEKPRKLRICLADEDRERVFPQYYKCYGASGLLCKGDGEVAHRVTGTGDLEELVCPGPMDCDFAKSKGKSGKPGCKRLASLQFFLPELPVMQVFQLDTTSFNSIVNINTALDLLERLAGRLSMVAVDLIIRPQQATNPEDNKKITIFVIDIVLPVGLSQLKQLQVFGNGVPAIAPPPVETAPDDLYARSQLTHTPAATVEIDGAQVDTETGEIMADSEEVWQEPARQAYDDEVADAPGLVIENDPAVMAALSGCTAAKRKALLASAKSNGWTIEQLCKAAGVDPAKAVDQARARQSRQTAPVDVTHTVTAPAANETQRALF